MNDTNYDETDKVIIEYADIENVPLKTMINVGFTLKKKKYLMSMLRKSYTQLENIRSPCFNGRLTL